MLSAWLDSAIQRFCDCHEYGTFLSLSWNVKGLIAIILVSIVCGAVGSLVVGNRMAFFSDALAHCAFAGISLGFLTALARGVTKQSEFTPYVTPVMVAFGVVVGLLIAFVREKSSLSSDTVIGVFFAGALGFGAIILVFVRQRKYFQPESFLFGDLLTVTSGDLITLFLLTVLTAVVLWYLYNDLVLTSFNPSLALSRRVRVRLCGYTFVVLLALIVNLCLQSVGALLINALLVVPAATASNLCRNMRWLFWTTILLCLGVGLAGQWLSWEIHVADAARNNNPIILGVGGIMVVLSVLLFALSMVVGPLFRRVRAA